MADFNYNHTSRKPLTENTVAGNLVGGRLLPQSSNPLTAGQRGFYVGTDGEFYYYDGTNPAFKLTNVGAPVAGPGNAQSGGPAGGYQKVLTFAGAGTTTSATFVDVGASMVNQTFITPVGGDHLVSVAFECYETGASTLGEYAVNIDGTDYAVGTRLFNVTSVNYETFVGSVVVSLAAGSHTIRPRWRRVSGAGTLASDGGPAKVAIQANGAGISGVSVVESTIASDFTITSTLPTYQDTGYSVTVNALEGERVQLSYFSSISGSSGTRTAYLAYQVDGGTDNGMAFTVVTDAAGVQEIGFSTLSVPLTAGQHTIKLRACKGTAIGTTLSASNNSSGTLAKFQATRFAIGGAGAGLVPTTASLASAFAITATGSYADVTGLSVTFATQVPNESVLFGFNGTMNTAGAPVAAYFAYQLDGGADNRMEVVSLTANASAFPIGFSVPVQVPTAGTHTIKLRAFRDAGANINILSLGGGGYVNSYVSVHQFRGGVIPVKDSSGNTIVQQPLALSFGNGAVVSNQAGEARVDFPNASLGGYVKTLDFSPNQAVAITSPTYTDIPGVSAATFTTPVSGPHVITLFNHLFITGTGYTYFTERVLIDGVTAGEFQSAPIQPIELPITQQVVVDLAAGTHTIVPQIRRDSTSGGNSVFVRSGECRVTIQAQGAGINGLEVVETSLASDFTVTQVYSNVPGAAMAQVDAVQVVVNTLEGERVQVGFVGTVSQLGGGYRDVIYGYQVDSGAAVVVSDINHETTSGQQTTVSFSTFTAALTAGQHTVKLMAAKANTNGAVFLGTATGAYAGNRFQVTRFKSFGIGAGNIVTSVNPVVAPHITSEYPTWQDMAGYSLSVSTIAGEQVQVSFSGDLFPDTGVGNGYAWLGYSVDGGADVEATTSWIGGQYLAVNGNFSVMTAPLTAGTHTIKLRGMKQTSTGTFSPILQLGMVGFQVTQYRGGLIPVLSNGASVVDKPTALNFVGGTVVTVGQNGRADINMGNAALGGFTQALSFTTSAASTTSATFADIAGVVDQTLTTPVSGTHLFNLYVNDIYALSSSAYAEWSVCVDGVDYSLGNMPINQLGNFTAASALSAAVNLAAGAHTVRYRWRRYAGSGSINVDASQVHKLTIQAQGTGINGLETVTDGLPGDFTVTQVWGAGSVEDSGYSAVVNTLEGERVQVGLTTTVYNSTVGTGILAVVYRVDADPYVRVLDVAMLDTGAEKPVTFNVLTAPLAAGSHTVKIQVAKIVLSGTFTPVIYSYTPGLQLTRFKSFGIGAGTLVASADLSSDFSVTGTSYANVTGSLVSFNTVAGEKVELDLSGWAYANPASIGGTLHLAYSLDAGADVPVMAVSSPAAAFAINAGFSIPVTVATAGAHTVQLRAKKSTPSDNWTLNGNVANGGVLRLTATQFRGGLIPIMRNGVSVVDKPDSVDFSTDFGVTNPSGLKAFIDLPSIDLSTLNKVLPLAHNTVDIGADLTRFKDVYYSGVLYGGASPMRLSSKEADGATAVGFELNTSATLANAAAKLLVVKNNGVEKFALDRDGRAAGYHRSSSITYISGTGTAGVDGTAATLKTLVLPADTLTQVGDRIRVRAYWKGDTGTAITGSTSLGPAGTEVLIGDTTDSGAASFEVVESWLHYIDSTHANIIENEGGALGPQSNNNVAGFTWNAAQNIIFAQDAIGNNHCILYALIVDVLPKGV